MTQEEKQLLLKDLCARLPYGVKCHYTPKKEDDFDHKTDFSIRCIDKDGNIVPNNLSFRLNYTVEQVRPYLRPMSSMTKEERKYISDKCGFSISGPIRNECELIMPVLAADWLIDFYNEHHIDYRGLIEKGLALEAPENMYKTE